MATFAERLKELRKNGNLTQKQLGEIIGLSERTVQSYELSDRRPTLEVTAQIADFFQVSLDYLIGRDNIMRH